MTAVDRLTFIIAIGFTPIWLARELWTLWKKKHPISVVLRRTGWQFSAFIYFWSSMQVHWWVPVPWGTSPLRTTLFWLIQALLLVWNIVWWKRLDRPVEEWEPWQRWVNWPVWYLIAGPLTAALFFPQNQVLPW